MMRWQPAPRPLLPDGWKEVELPSILVAMGSPPGAQRAFTRSNGLRVLVDCAEKADGRLWLHASMSYENRLPSYRDMCEVKRIFIGIHRTAVQVFPRQGEHVNLHEYCLHLWSCIEGAPFPDFSEGWGTI